MYCDRSLPPERYATSSWKWAICSSARRPTKAILRVVRSCGTVGAAVNVMSGAAREGVDAVEHPERKSEVSMRATPLWRSGRVMSSTLRSPSHIDYVADHGYASAPTVAGHGRAGARSRRLIPSHHAALVPLLTLGVARHRVRPSLSTAR
jgi:hypothetical protein